MAVVRKSEFAKLTNVTKAQVSQWITAGYLTAPALVGTGKSQMVDIELGMAQVEERRAVNESYGLNGLDTNLTPPAEPAVVHALPPKGTTRVLVIPEGETEGTVDARIKAEKLKQNELLTNQLKLENAARHGKYVDA